MSTTRYATFCQRRCIFNVASSRRRVPFLSGPVGGSALKGGGHILAVPSHASRGACCHCRYPQSRNDHAHASYGSIVPDHPGQIEYQRRRMWTEESSQQIGLVDNTVLSTIVIVIRQLFGGCRQLLSYRNDFVKLCCSLRDTSDVCTPVSMFFSCKAISCGLQKVSRKFSADRLLVCFVCKSVAQMIFRSLNYIDDLLLWKAIVTRHVKKLEGSFAAISLNLLQSETSVLPKWHLVNR